MTIGRHKKRGSLNPPAAPGNQIPGSAIPFTEVLKPRELRTGESYDAWDCGDCGKMIALAKMVPGTGSLVLSHTVLRIPCPHCGTRRLYPSSARRVRVYRGP
jgi:predicted RNA-binding Zn-ribbon protein involved in translation (DUF1610 family)